MRFRIQNINEEDEVYRDSTTAHDTLGAFVDAMKLLEEFPNDSVVIHIIPD
jgi:hypothetical protein